MDLVTGVWAWNCYWFSRPCQWPQWMWYILSLILSLKKAAYVRRDLITQSTWSLLTTSFSSTMLWLRGCECSTHTDWLSEPEDAVPSFPQLSPAVTQENSEIALFQRTMLLAEAMNKLKHRVNQEKHTWCSNPNYLEVVSSNEEEIEVPIMSIPLTSSSLLPSQTLIGPTPFPLVVPLPHKDALMPEDPMHIPTQFPVSSGPCVAPPVTHEFSNAQFTASHPHLSATDWSLHK